MTGWKTCDVITAERLNGMQKEPLIVHAVEEGSTATLDKTWKEIKTAFLNGLNVILDNSYENDEIYINLVRVELGANIYYVDFYDGSDNLRYSTNSENDYPSINYD